MFALLPVAITANDYGFDRWQQLKKDHETELLKNNERRVWKGILTNFDVIGVVVQVGVGKIDVGGEIFEFQVTNRKLWDEFRQLLKHEVVITYLSEDYPHIHNRAILTAQSID